VVPLTEKTVILYASKAYDRPGCIQSEFRKDLQRFRYLNRLLRRYHRTGKIRERLVLNHLVVLYNVFGVSATTRLVFFYVEPAYHGALKTFLLFLSYMPERIENIRGTTIHSASIQLDMTIAEILRGIRHA